METPTSHSIRQNGPVLQDPLVLDALRIAENTQDMRRATTGLPSPVWLEIVERAGTASGRFSRVAYPIDVAST